MRAYGLDNKKPGTSTTLLANFTFSSIAEASIETKKR